MEIIIKPTAYIRDAIAALLILILNFAIVFAAVFIFLEFIEPGHPAFIL